MYNKKSFTSAIFNLSGAEKSIGYSFKNKDLLRQCFTHSSYANENKQAKDNESLEFLGDSVLGFIVADYLYNKFQGAAEGSLTKYKISLVSHDTLAAQSKKYGFAEFVLYGNGERDNVMNRANTAENLFEAIIGGIFLDGGIENARRFIKTHLIDDSQLSCDNAKVPENSKNLFQEYVQKNGLPLPEYRLVSKSGPDSKPIFTVAIYENGEKLAERQGGTKKQAEKECAAAALPIIKAKGAANK